MLKISPIFMVALVASCGTTNNSSLSEKTYQSTSESRIWEQFGVSFVVSKDLMSYAQAVDYCDDLDLVTATDVENYKVKVPRRIKTSHSLVWLAHSGKRLKKKYWLYDWSKARVAQAPNSKGPVHALCRDGNFGSTGPTKPPKEPGKPGSSKKQIFCRAGSITGWVKGTRPKFTMYACDWGSTLDEAKRRAQARCRNYPKSKRIQTSSGSFMAYHNCAPFAPQCGFRDFIDCYGGPYG